MILKKTELSTLTINYSIQKVKENWTRVSNQEISTLVNILYVAIKNETDKGVRLIMFHHQFEIV